MTDHNNGTNGNDQNKPQKKEKETFVKDFKYYYSIMLNRWYWLALGLIAGLSLFYFSIRYSTKQYKVSGSVLIENTEEKSVSKEALTRELGFDKGESNMEDRIRVLGSTELMHRIVDSLSLNIAYIQEGHVKTNELYLVKPLKLLYWNTEGAPKSFQIKIKHVDSLLFSLILAEDKLELLHYGVPFRYEGRELVLKKVGYLTKDYPILIKVSDKYAAAETFCSRLEITQVGRSNILNISTIDEIPERGIAIINRLVREYGASIVEGKNDAGQRTMSFINQRLNYVASELFSVETKEVGFKTNHSLPIALPEMTKTYIDKSSAIEEKSMALDIRLDQVKSIETIISDPAGGYRALPFSTEILSSTPLVGLITKYNDLISKRSKLLESAEVNNPATKTMEEEMKNLKSNILVSIQTVKQEVNDQKDRYRQQIIPLENQINMMPNNERELAQIMREKGIRETLFLFLLQKREETAVNVAAQVANSRMLERAANRGVVSPKPLQMGLFYVFLGLMIPMFGLYLMDLFNTKIHHRADIDAHLDLPFVGFLPHIRRKRNKLIINDSHSVLAESFRLVRSNLQNTDVAPKNRTVLITSTISGEGKTFVAANLATTLALTGKKVIVLGLDLRKPKLEMYLEGQKTERGIAQFLKGEETNLKDLVQTYDRLPNLHYLDCGAIPRNPSELLMTDKIKKLFDYCTNNYDFVVVDGAPIGIVADTFLLKDFIGQTVVVLRYGYSTTAHLKFMKEVEENHKLPNMNVLLNDVRQERGNSYNYGYYSAYYYNQEGNSLWAKTKRMFKSAA